MAARAGNVSFSDSERAAFEEGVQWAKEHGLAGGLFRVRTRAVLGGRPLPENTWFFSGLLIGAELADVERTAERPILLAAASPLSDLYAQALRTILPGTDWTQLPPAEVERSTIAAHALFLRHRL
jgi:2-dehydro-3-deoxygalactonokinase